MVKYALTNKAVADLSGIWTYTYEAWSESQADKYYALLIDACEAIAQNPEAGKSYPELDRNILGYPTGRHIIFYHIASPGLLVVLRILHEQMDLKNRIEE